MTKAYDTAKQKTAENRMSEDTGMVSQPHPITGAPNCSLPNPPHTGSCLPRSSNPTSLVSHAPPRIFCLWGLPKELRLGATAQRTRKCKLQWGTLPSQRVKNISNWNMGDSHLSYSSE